MTLSAKAVATIPRLTRSMAVAALTACAVAIAPSEARAQSTTLNFGTPGGFLQCLVNGQPLSLNAPYGGFIFGGARLAQPSQFAGGCAATNSGLGTLSTVAAVGGGLFNFESAIFSGAFPTAGTAITVSGFRDGMTIFTASLMLGASPGAGTLFTNTTAGAVDRLEFVQTGANPFLFDDFTTNLATNATVVPEPFSIALLGSGLLGLYPAARRRRRDKTV
ncbi:hypothetical protein BH23GEM8_BH23GEM8_05230 [soil metagenome]